MYRETDRPSSITPGFAIRVAVMGGFALIFFGIIFFRLWYLQVLSGDKYRQEANNNQVRNITVQAPRGRIVDVNGQVLVDNRVGYSVQVDPSKLPVMPTKQNGYSARAAPDMRIYKRLAPVVGMSAQSIAQTVGKQFLALQFGKATVKTDVQPPVYMYILENQDDFPGVTVEQVFLRVYPRHDVGGQLFGTVGQITAPELKTKAYSGVQQGDRVGQSGIESSYDRYLRGVDGADQVQVDASGTLRGELSVKAPQVGHQLRLTLDQNLEQTGQDAMQGQAGAFVVMDVHSGAIVALGSSPTFDPNELSNGISESNYKALIDPANGAPLDNRAIQGLYATGSTFKLITATASLQSGVSTPDTVINDPGSLTVGGTTFKDDDGAGSGAVALPEAIKVSSDVYFYTLGEWMNSAGNGHDLQHWAHLLGLGQPTGIDLPAESPGLIPSPEWRNALYRRLLKQDPGCAATEICRPWSVGDNINLAVGQGDVEVTPLQLATAYATVANGGTVPRPHLGDDIEDSTGRVLQQLSFPPMRHLSLDPANTSAILDGMHQAAQTPGGTSDPVFGNFPIPIAGKTGTAQRGNGTETPQSWYAALAPYPNPKYVAVATFETGGYGVQTAAPAVEKILAQLFNVHLKPGQASNSTPSGVNLFG